MAGLALNAITKSYGSVSVIEGVSLSVADGEFVALVGPSGCGKSTILRMIAGLEDISGGEISIGGSVVNELTPRERNVAMVFQTYALYPHMNVYKNMAFNLELSGQPKDEIARRVKEAARMLELESLLERKPSELSGGQRQRVAMGRAIVRNPAVFLFDEPLSNLDAKLRVQMRSEIKALHTKVGVTSVYVTHDQVEAMTLADRVVVLNQGAIQQEGTPLELYRRPANMFVAGFIGSPSMNFFDAVIDGDSAVTPAGIRFAFSSETPIASGTKVVVGIRPEHFITGSGPILAKVDYVEPTGGQSYVMTSIGDAQAMIVVSGDLEIKAGDTVALEAPPSRTYLFEPEGGKRISQN